jgi:DNA-binding NarL/FixJ family response regulator
MQEQRFAAARSHGDGKLRVVVADDHDLFRRGLRELLEENGLDVVGEASNGRLAIELGERLRPDVVIMDLHMPVVSGIEATRRLAQSATDVRIVVLTVLADETSVVDAVVAGAAGYLLKDASVEQIVGGIEAAARGEALISTRIAAMVLRRVRDAAPAVCEPLGVELSRRELDVLSLMADGQDNAAIAKRLSISSHTVKTHVSTILDKLGVENRIQAAVRAIRSGMLEP